MTSSDDTPRLPSHATRSPLEANGAAHDQAEHVPPRIPPYIPPHIPSKIPQGARIVVRTDAGIDERTGRRTYRDFLGHVVSWDGTTLVLDRDPSADGRRAAERVRIHAAQIVRLKPIPERRVHRA